MKSLKRNLFYQSAYQLLVIISPLITSPYIARTLGNEMYGVYTYYYSIAYCFGIFVILGMAEYGNRTIAMIKAENKDKLNETFSQLVCLQLCLLILISIIYFISVQLFGGNYRRTAVIEWLYIFSVGLDISWFYFGIEKFKTTTIRSFFVKSGMIVCILSFIKTPDDLNLYTMIMAGGTFLSSLILWGQLHKYVRFTKVSFQDMLHHVKPILSLFIPAVSLLLFYYTDKVMLGFMSTWQELGFYTNSEKIVNMPMSLIYGLGVVMLPRISALTVSNDTDQIDNYINTSILLSTWAGIALCFGIKAVSGDFVPFFFGEGYTRCTDVLAWLSMVIIMKAVSNVLATQYLIPMEKEKVLNLSVILAESVNIIANCILIRRYGATGAVIGTLIAEMIVLLIYFFTSREKIRLKKITVPFLVSLMSGIFMERIIGLIMSRITLQILIVRLIMEVCIGGTVYCLLTFSALYLLRRCHMIQITFTR